MRTPNEEFEYLIQFVSAAREFAENVARAPTLKKKSLETSCHTED